MWLEDFFFFFLGTKWQTFATKKNHSFGGGKVSSHILDNEFLEAAKQIGFLTGPNYMGAM
jgi:hypothetical protein